MTLKQEYALKAFNIEKMSDYRRNSLAQKLRRDLLRSLIYRPSFKKGHHILFNQIEKILEKKFNNIENIISYNFEKNFDQNILSPFNSDMKNMNETKDARKLVKLFQGLNNPNLSLFIHGSHADSKITNYSDIDVSIFVKIDKQINLKEIRHDISLLNNMTKSIDLESHHSIFINLESDFDCYPEGFMPLEVLIRSAVPRDQNLNIRKIRFGRDITIDTFFRLFESIKNLIKQNNNSISNIKNIISSYFMLLILKDEILTDKYRDKKTIFNNFILNEKYSEHYKTYETCSEIRQKWPLQESNLNLGFSKIFINQIVNHVDELQKEILDSSNFKNTFEII